MKRLTAPLPAARAACLLVVAWTAAAGTCFPVSGAMAAEGRTAVTVAEGHSGPASSPSSRFVAGIEDLPLMPGLAPVDDETLVFDNPAGRIVQAAARGRVKVDAVSAFYLRTLPQLGWRAVAKDRFQREDERLELDFQAISGATSGAVGQAPATVDPITVRFTLIPQ